MASPRHRRKRSLQLYFSQQNLLQNSLTWSRTNKKLYNGSYRNGMGARGLASSGSKFGPVVTSCEHGNKYLGFKKRGKSLESDL